MRCDNGLNLWNQIISRVEGNAGRPEDLIPAKGQGTNFFSQRGVGQGATILLILFAQLQIWLGFDWKGQGWKFLRVRSSDGDLSGFGSFNTARRTIRGYESMNMIRKGQIENVKKGDVMGQISFIHEIFGIVA
jgi:hypothetical protein